MFLIFLTILFANGDNISGNILVLFPFFLLFFSIGLLLIYLTVMQWRNYTYIVANKEHITVSYGSVPSPLFRNQHIEATQLKRLYSKRYSKNQNKINDTYIIHADTTRVIEETLVRVDSREEALFIERTLEDYYNIEDQPQKGEIGGPKINVLDMLFGNR